MFFILSVIAGAVLALSNGSGDKGYKLRDTNGYEVLSFNKGESGSSVDTMYVYNNSGKTLFAPTKRNSEFASLLANAPNVGGFKQYEYYTTSCGSTCSTGKVENRNDHMDKGIYVPVSGTYRFLLNIQRQIFQSSEDFRLYVDLNRDGDFNDGGEYLATFADTGTDDDDISRGKGKWAATNSDGSGSQISRYLIGGRSYKFRMKAANNSGMNVGIGRIRLYTY